MCIALIANFAHSTAATPNNTDFDSVSDAQCAILLPCTVKALSELTAIGATVATARTSMYTLLIITFTAISSSLSTSMGLGIGSAFMPVLSKREMQQKETCDTIVVYNIYNDVFSASANAGTKCAALAALCTVCNIHGVGTVAALASQRRLRNIVQLCLTDVYDPKQSFQSFLRRHYDVGTHLATKIPRREVHISVTLTSPLRWQMYAVQNHCGSRVPLLSSWPHTQQCTNDSATIGISDCITDKHMNGLPVNHVGSSIGHLVRELCITMSKCIFQRVTVSTKHHLNRSNNMRSTIIIFIYEAISNNASLHHERSHEYHLLSGYCRYSIIEHIHITHIFEHYNNLAFNLTLFMNKHTIHFSTCPLHLPNK